MTTVLLDGNVLIALTNHRHVHHRPARAWWDGFGSPFATSPITQGTLVRHLLREGLPAQPAWEVLDALLVHERHELWPDDVSYSAGMLQEVLGHRQVTDSYLADSARRRGGRLATFDPGLATSHADVAVLVSS